MARGASFSDELAQLELSLSEEERQRVVSRVDGEDVDVEVLRRNVQWAARQQGLKIKPRALLLRAPKLMCSPAHELQVWYDFFTSYGERMSTARVTDHSSGIVHARVCSASPFAAPRRL